MPKNVNKVEINGEIILDITGDTVTEEFLFEGKTAHDKTGTQITGTAKDTRLRAKVYVDSGSTVTATKGSQSVSGVSENGSVTLLLPESGAWTFTATKDGESSAPKTENMRTDYEVELSYFTATITVTAPSGATVTLKKGGVTLETKTSTATTVFTVREAGAYTVEGQDGSAIASAEVVVTEEQTAYNVTLTFVSMTLNENSWETIRAVSDAGTAANYWSVGDTKEITLNGSIGVLTLGNYSVYAYIIGIDHNAELEGANRIHFMIGKTAQEGGTDIAFCDDYGEFEEGLWRFNHKAESTNSNGWSGSHIRSTICENMKSAMPEELQSVLKTVQKYTQNNLGSGAMQVTATNDTLFLLSECEVTGETAHSVKKEGEMQAQYAYYEAGNSKLKYKHNSQTNAAIYWLRSPSASNNTNYVTIETNGRAGNKNAVYSYALAAAFCV